MRVKLLLPSDPTWNAEIDRIGALLDVQNNPTVFPYHFLQVVLPSIGGAMVEVTADADASAKAPSRYLLVGFILPRGIRHDHNVSSPGQSFAPAREYTLRYHSLHEEGRIESIIAEIAESVRVQLGAAAVVPYAPQAHHHFTRTQTTTGSSQIGHPDRDEADHIRALHQQIWNSPPEYLYPTDIHSDEFRLGTSLVARVEADVAGFLFGFYRFGGPALPSAWADRFDSELRLESQVMGVLPQYRGMRLGNLLKRAQAELALTENISLIHWTADPLQYPNAALNFGLLRAVAFSFRPDYYPFRNDLNRVSASRFAITWMIDTERVCNVPLTGSSALILDMQPEFVRVNEAYRNIRLAVDEEYIAIQIPPDWGEIQRNNISEAQRWREATDRLFNHYVGIEDDQYVITGVAVKDDERYLIGQHTSNALWQRLAL